MNISRATGISQLPNRLVTASQRYRMFAQEHLASVGLLT